MILEANIIITVLQDNLRLSVPRDAGPGARVPRFVDKLPLVQEAYGLRTIFVALNGWEAWL
jgi:hypothetical protein